MTGSLPLGIDLGSSRIRVAHGCRTGDGSFRLCGVATRDLPVDAVTAGRIDEVELIAAILEDLRDELGVTERRCVASLGEGVATVRTVHFPAMRERERRAAAIFEAETFAPWLGEHSCVVRVHPTDGAGAFLVGIARRDAVDTRAACLRAAGLRVAAIDHDASALRRAFPAHDAVIDFGLTSVTIHAGRPGSEFSTRLSYGGDDITRAIAADLTIGSVDAERRKRTSGTAGAGESARTRLIDEVTVAVGSAVERFPVDRIALVGNGARLTGLRTDLEASTRCVTELAIPPLCLQGTYPDDVTRAAAPDWALAIALAARECVR